MLPWGWNHRRNVAQVMAPLEPLGTILPCRGHWNASHKELPSRMAVSLIVVKVTHGKCGSNPLLRAILKIQVRVFKIVSNLSIAMFCSYATCNVLQLRYLQYFAVTPLVMFGFSFTPVLMKDAQCDESNKKLIFLFLLFEL